MAVIGYYYCLLNRDLSEFHPCPGKVRDRRRKSYERPRQVWHSEVSRHRHGIRRRDNAASRARARGGTPFENVFHHHRLRPGSGQVKSEAKEYPYKISKESNVFHDTALLDVNVPSPEQAHAERCNTSVRPGQGQTEVVCLVPNRRCLSVDQCRTTPP